MPDFAWPLVCPTGQAGELQTRLPRHCAACHSHQPPAGCTYPAYSPYWRDLLVTDFVRRLDHTPATANAAVDQLEYRRYHSPALQLPLFELNDNEHPCLCP